MLVKQFIGLDNMLNYNRLDSEKESVRCKNCDTLNSFSYDHHRHNCIKCNTKLSDREIDKAIEYRETLFTKERFNSPSPWNNNSGVAI